MITKLLRFDGLCGGQQHGKKAFQAAVIIKYIWVQKQEDWFVVQGSHVLIIKAGSYRFML